ncbi:MAG: hypothetical protein U0V87_00545 [Acidobacteriota bacterium]
MNQATALELLVALLVSAGGCLLLARWIPPQPGSLTPQMLRTAGRMLWVLLLVTLGIGVWKRTPWAITVGTLAGWAAAGAWSELQREPRKGMRE